MVVVVVVLLLPNAVRLTLLRLVASCMVVGFLSGCDSGRRTSGVDAEVLRRQMAGVLGVPYVRACGCVVWSLWCVGSGVAG
jgi:hypothetical protein